MTLFLLALLVPSAHAAKRVAPDVVEDAMAYGETDRSKAIAILTDALASGPKAKHIAALQVHLGEQQRLSGAFGEAAATFSDALADAPEGPWADAARLGKILAAADDGIGASGMAELHRISEKVVLETQNADRFFLLAIDATRANQPTKVSTYSKKSLNYAKSDRAVHERIKAGFSSLAEGAEPTLSGEPSGSQLERALAAMANGDRKRAAELARKAQSKLEPGSFEALQAKYLIRHENAAPVRNTIAVLLPTSGKFEAVGRQVRQAVEFGYLAGGGTAELVFVDSGADAETTVAALEDAVFNRGAMGVLGPLLSDGTDEVVRAAAAMQVPLISLSQANETREFEWVFQGVPSVGDQSAALVKHAMVQEEMKSFAIFAPDNAYGHRAAEAFRKAVDGRGGRVTVETFYDPKANSLMKYASTLGRKNPASRKGELYRLRQEAEAKGGNPDSVVLPPRIDFDAIFIPDNARKIPIACAALAYEEFPVGEFRPKRGQKTLPLLGLNGWNNNSLVAAGGEYVRGSRFTDAFYAKSASSFVQQYKAKHSRTPSSLEAVVVDAARMLGTAARGTTDREGLRNALDTVEVSGTPTRTTGFDDEARRSQSKIHILTIDREGLRPVSVTSE